DAARNLAYRHTGRFDVRCLRQLDDRPGTNEGDQFHYRLTNAGAVRKNSPEALETAQFELLLDSVELSLRQMGEAVYSGRAEVSPCKKGAMTACEQCSYRSICRIDPWLHSFRVLRPKSQ
ncbi:MAG TPA: hypothetical protein VHI52_04630, partial [Verrucomicrobiae bacterium]|nr:hypothetical protein [Verrucomicrobiae bacterium]